MIRVNLVKKGELLAFYASSYMNSVKIKCITHTLANGTHLAGSIYVHYLPPKLCGILALPTEPIKELEEFEPKLFLTLRPPTIQEIIPFRGETTCKLPVIEEFQVNCELVGRPRTTFTWINPSVPEKTHEEQFYWHKLR